METPIVKIMIWKMPYRPEHMLYIDWYDREKNCAYEWGSYNVKTGELRLKNLKENPLRKYMNVIMDYCLQERVQQNGVSFQIRY